MTDAVARMERAAQWWASFQEADPSEEQIRQWLVWLEESPENSECFKQINQFAQQLHRTRELTVRPLGVPHSRAFVFKPALAASFLIAATLLLTGFWLATSLRSTERVTYTTAIADQRGILLPDGSLMILGGASTARTLFSPDEREVRLTGGEAYFEVKPDAAGRPFVVDTGTAAVQVLGTVFNVRKNERQVAVTVAEGRVKVVRPGTFFQSLLEFSGLRHSSGAEAGRDQQVLVEAGGAELQATPASARRAGAWRKGRLEFADEPLDIVIENVSRYSPVGISAEAGLRDITYTGTFVPGQVDAWLAALEEVFNLHAKRGPDGIVLRRRPPASAAR